MWGAKSEDLEDRADERTDGLIPQALLVKPDLPTWLTPIHEAFWLLIHSTGANGGGMAAFHIQPPRISDVVALADLMGFDALYFLRVIAPSLGLYRESISARMASK